METFSPTKLHNLICYLLNNIGHELGTVELVKLIYLIDVAYYRLFGKTLSGLNYIREVKGPYTRDITNAVTDLELYEVTKTVKPSRYHSPILKNAHTPGPNPRFKPSLDPEEKEIVDRVIRKLKDLSPKQIENIAYKTEPMLVIQKMEAKVGQTLQGTKIDFSYIKRDGFMQEVLNNRGKKSAEDLVYERDLLSEREEIDRLMA